MASVNMNIRMDSNIKKQAQQIFADLGLDMSTAVNLFLRKAIRENGIPFDLKLDTPNEETLKAIEDVNNGRNLSKVFSSVEELMEDLNA